MRPAPVVAAGTGAAFLVVLTLVVAGWDPLHSFDVEAVRRATDPTRDYDGYRRTLQVLTTVLNSGWTVLAVGVVAALVWARGRAGSALWLLGVVVAGNLIGPTLKQIVDRQRPDLPEPIQTFNGLSFPSGHAGSATLAAAAVLLVAWPRLGPAARGLAVVVALALPLTSAWTRLALGGHYPSDLLGGFLLGTAWVAAWAPTLPRLATRLDTPPDVSTPREEARATEA
ncbi:MAG: phosphatase PAP2 family protein [Sporichthyaceae bacterium]